MSENEKTTIEKAGVKAKTASRPLRADAERNRRLILTAASKAFAERGLNVTMDEIAARAGVGVGTIYRRFVDRDELIEALFDEQVGRVTRVAEESLKFEIAWDGIVHLIEGLAAAHAFNRSLRDLLFSTRVGHEWAARARARIEPPVSELVARAQREGDLRDDVSATDVPLIEIALTGVLDLPIGSERVLRRLSGIVLDGLRTKREGPTPLAGPPLRPEELTEQMLG